MNVASGHDELPLLVLADRIHTLHNGATAHGAVLIRHGRILASGPAHSLRPLADGADILDLRGSIITPGLTDSHIHLTEWAFARREADLSAAASPALAARAVAEHRPVASSGWVRGRGWNPHLWRGELPHRGQLDALIPDRPVALQSHDMHSLWVNSAALALAGIGAATPDPAGGTIVRDAAGEATGLLLEWAGQLVTNVMPDATLAETTRAVLEAQAALHALGVTGVHSFPGIHRPEPDPLPVLLGMRERAELRLRVLQHIRLDRLADALHLGLRSGFGDEWLRIGALKMFLDGALGSRTAWMRAPYEDGSGCGMNTLDPDEFRAHVARAAAGGIACTVHAIGDAAVSLALDVLADPATRVAALPHRIEHIQCCPVERFGDAAAAGIVCSMQPSHLMTDWRIADRHWGAARSSGTFAIGSLLRAGTALAFGSDAPVEAVDPRRGLFAAVRRQDDAAQPPGGWFPDECISAAAALHGYTVGAARAAGLPAPAGSLAPGAPADLVAWDGDPLAEPAALLQLRCVAAIVGGRVVHRI
ncbi:MAG TPA: amidohydrolase [Longimicrobiales bacterium]|nr:amidohydrolase [Longimicrobiales bacterium]